MSLPHSNITPIPDNEPDAVPSLWNKRYEEIDENFSELDDRTESLETEVTEARGDEDDLDSRLDKMQSSIEGLDPEMQNAIISLVTQAMDQAGLAGREIQATLNKRFQTGVVTISNRGVISGCTVDKSSDATRNLNLDGGPTFLGGRIVPAKDQPNGASVPSNTSDEEQSCYAYLIMSDGELDFACTELGEETPEDGLALYRVDVPAGNDEDSDPYLDECDLVDIRREESGWPQEMQTSPTDYVELEYELDGEDYHVDLEVESFDGSAFELGFVYTENKAQNGFDVYYNGVADNVKIRWTARKLNM